MRHLLVLLACSALILPLSVTAQTPAPAAQTPEQTYAAVFVRLALGNISRLTPCYQGREAELREVKQRIRSVRVTINPDGHVGQVVATPRNAMPADVLACFLGVIRSWAVPPPADGRPLRLRFLRSHFF